MLELDISSDALITALLDLAESETVSVLDSCGVRHLGSHRLVAGVSPVKVLQTSDADPYRTLALLDNNLASELASIFTISYDFGKKLLTIPQRRTAFHGPYEPDVFIANYDALIVHDYDTNRTKIVGKAEKCASLKHLLEQSKSCSNGGQDPHDAFSRSNFTRVEYLAAIETIKEQIRNGDTYQTNLTQRLTTNLPAGLSPEIVFARLRRYHPAPFAAYIKRLDSTVVSASPERFFKVDRTSNTISTSPIKGTRPRGETPAEDVEIRNDLLASGKDRAENTMIVDLLRNDLGRVCEFGSVRVEKLCDLEEHPTLFHLVSTIKGELREDTRFSEILHALFPCGSITGAPKLSTMKIIDDIEPSQRGLSMGAIGYHIPGGEAFGMLDSLDLSVAIRTMVIRDQIATFNVGGGIVIDSDPDSEYQETLTKAVALLDALGARLTN